MGYDRRTLDVECAYQHFIKNCNHCTYTSSLRILNVVRPTRTFYTLITYDKNITNRYKNYAMLTY